MRPLGNRHRIQKPLCIPLGARNSPRWTQADPSLQKLTELFFRTTRLNLEELLNVRAVAPPEKTWYRRTESVYVKLNLGYRQYDPAAR
jgi:hypothetical protein